MPHATPIHPYLLARRQCRRTPQEYPEHLADGLKPWRAQKLYFTAYPRGVMRGTMEQILGSQPHMQLFSNVATIPLEEMGTAEEEITTTLSLDDALYAVRTQASDAWTSQQNPNRPYARLSPEAVRAVWGTQYFVLAVPPNQAPDGREYDLFAGIMR